MPTNRNKRTRTSQNDSLAPIHEFLETGEANAETWMMSFSDDETREGWKTCRADILQKWARYRPCKRPWAWWRYDSPEPRKRLGGKGSPYYEVMGWVHELSFGLPDRWALPIHIERYGRGEVFDPNDPPIFESEAAFLERHNLLSALERKWLAAHKEALEPEVIKNE